MPTSSHASGSPSEHPLSWRTPLSEPAWEQTLTRLREHPGAPRFNHEAGDRLLASDVTALRAFREGLKHARRRCFERRPPPAVLEKLEQVLPHVAHLAERLPEGFRLEHSWEELPTMSRADLAEHPERLVPDHVSLESLLVYRTAGTTGHALLVPHEARAAAAYQPLIEHALSRYGVELPKGPDKVVCFLLGAQAHTVTYPCNLSYFGGAGFAKLNLNGADWPSEQAMLDYLAHFDPPLLTGDPLTFAELLRLKPELHPRALLSTAVAMSPGLKGLLEQHFGCPVIDWYSLTETGPLGYACPLGHGYHQLSEDLFLEVLREDGMSLPPGERGELVVSGGRNPFFPLFRYRTGDWGVMDFEPCPCGDPLPRLRGLEGRAPVKLVSTSGRLVNTVDVSRVLRAFPILQHELEQEHTHRIRLRVRPLGVGAPLRLPLLEKALRALFGEDMELELEVDLSLGKRQAGAGTGDGKILPYKSRLLLEE